MNAERVTLTLTLDPSWQDAARPAEDAGAFARRTVSAAAKAAGAPIVSAQVKRRSSRRREPLDQGTVIGQLVRALAGKAGDDLDPLVALAKLSRQLDDAMTAAAIEARRAGHSWTTIAGELGITRQGARQRWGKAAAAAGVDDAPAAAGQTVGD